MQTATLRRTKTHDHSHTSKLGSRCGCARPFGLTDKLEISWHRLINIATSNFQGVTCFSKGQLLDPVVPRHKLFLHGIVRYQIFFLTN